MYDSRTRYNENVRPRNKICHSMASVLDKSVDRNSLSENRSYSDFDDRVCGLARDN